MTVRVVDGVLRRRADDPERPDAMLPAPASQDHAARGQPGHVPGAPADLRRRRPHLGSDHVLVPATGTGGVFVRRPAGRADRQPHDDGGAGQEPVLRHTSAAAADGALIDPTEIAGTVLFLLGPDARDITGQTLVV